jgi:hypothetical protein
MVYMNHFIYVLEPAPEKFRISVVNKNHTQSHPQKQQRQRPQLFHVVHTDSPERKNSRTLKERRHSEECRLLWQTANSELKR